MFKQTIENKVMNLMMNSLKS